MATFRQRPAVPAVEASLDATVIQPRGGPLAPGPGQPARLLVVSGPRAGIVVALGHGELTFGRDGKPMYISGPNDDGEKTIRKLRRGLGDGNYDFVHAISG